MIWDSMRQTWVFSLEEQQEIRSILSDVCSNDTTLLNRPGATNVSLFMHSIEGVCSSYKSFFACGPIEHNKAKAFKKALENAMESLTDERALNFKLKMFKDFPFGSHANFTEDIQKIERLMNQAHSCMSKILAAALPYELLAEKGTSAVSGFVKDVAGAYELWVGEISNYEEGTFAKVLRLALHAAGYSHKDADVKGSIRSYLEAERRFRDAADDVPPGSGIMSKRQLQVPTADDCIRAKRLQKRKKKL